MSKTNSGLLAYAKAQLGLPYWYGTYGQTATAALYTAKKKQYPAYYTATDFSGQYGKRVHDCVGLIKGYLWSDSTTATPKYTALQDKSARGMYAAATEKGSISTFPGKAGQLLFKGSTASGISHVGVYGGDGYVYEAKGHAYGVVKSAYKAGDWSFWAQCPYCQDDSGAAVTTAEEDTGSSATVIKAGTAAKSRDTALSGSYRVLASVLNVRNGAGTEHKVLTTLSRGSTVKCYGYYTAVGSTNWLYVTFQKNGVSYVGFVSGKYVEK